MPAGSRDRKLIHPANLQHFFQDSIDQAARNQHVDTHDGTIVYLANLLTVFTRSENLFEPGDDGGLQLKPLALHYSEALNATSRHARAIALQRLGDIALFISGIFSNSLARKPVDIDYYVNMGGSAYSCLADIRDRRLNETALGEIFTELAQKFVEFVDVLNEVCEQTHTVSDRDLLRLYEVWMRTGSRRSEKQLREHGIHMGERQTNGRLH